MPPRQPQAWPLGERRHCVVQSEESHPKVPRRLNFAPGQELSVHYFRRLRATYPALPTINSVNEMLLTYACYYLGVLPFLPISADIFGIPFDAVDYARVRHNLPPAVSLASCMPACMHGPFH